MFTMRAHLRSDFHLTNSSAFASPPTMLTRPWDARVDRRAATRWQREGGRGWTRPPAPPNSGSAQSPQTCFGTDTRPASPSPRAASSTVTRDWSFRRVEEPPSSGISPPARSCSASSASARSAAAARFFYAGQSTSSLMDSAHHACKRGRTLSAGAFRLRPMWHATASRWSFESRLHLAHRATASCISSRSAAPSRRRPSGCLGASGARTGGPDPGHCRGTGGCCASAVSRSTSGLLGLGLRGGRSPCRTRCGCRSATGHGPVYVGFALALAGVASGPACHRIGRVLTRGAQYDGVPHVGIATQSGPLAAMVPSADIGLSRGGVRPVGATGPKRARRSELVRVQRPDLNAKSRRGPGHIVWQEELPPRGRTGVPVGLRLVVPSPSHLVADDGGSERGHGRSSSSSPGVPPHGFPSRGSQQAMDRRLKVERDSHERHRCGLAGDPRVGCHRRAPCIGPGPQSYCDPVVVPFVIEEPQRAPQTDVHRSYAGCFTHPEESGKGDDGKAQSRVVLMFRGMSRRVTSSAHTWVGPGAAVVVAAPRAMSQCTGRTLGGMQPSFSARRRADMTPRSVPGCWPMAARRTRYWDSAPAASSSGQCAANRPTSLRIAVQRSTVPGDHCLMANARGSSKKDVLD